MGPQIVAKPFLSVRKQHFYAFRALLRPFETFFLTQQETILQNCCIKISATNTYSCTCPLITQQRVYLVSAKIYHYSPIYYSRQQ